MAEPIRTDRTRGTDPVRLNLQATKWMEQARCIGLDPAVNNADEARDFANRNCRGCPVKTECLTYGINIKANSIVFGGTYFNVDGVPNHRWAVELADPRCA